MFSKVLIKTWTSTCSQVILPYRGVGTREGDVWPIWLAVLVMAMNFASLVKVSNSNKCAYNFSEFFFSAKLAKLNGKLIF